MKCLQIVASLGPALNSNGKRQWRLLALFLFAALLLPVANSLAGGTVLAWGNDSDNQCNVPVDLTDVVSVAGGGQHSLALKRDGTVVAWGWNVFGETDVPAGLTNVVAIAANAR